MLRRISFSGTAIVLAGLMLTNIALAQSQGLRAESARTGNVGASVKNTRATASAEDSLGLTEAQKLAFQTLETAEGASRGFEAPMRSYGLLQVGSTLATLDSQRARGLLRDAFTATLEIHDVNTKARMQSDLLRTLVPLSQPDAEELLFQAHSWVRNPIATLILRRYAERRQFDKGVELLHQIASVDELPYGGASALMEAMPPEMAAEKQALFIQAVASYKSHQHPDALIGDSTFTGMIRRFGLSMPPKLALQAIDEILNQAKTKADQEIKLAGMGGSARFASDYQYQLFALLSTLRKLDESQAKQLLDENQDLQTKMQQFPDGMNSLMPPLPPGGEQVPGKGPARASPGSTSARSGPPAATGGTLPVGTLQDYLRRDTQGRIDAIVQEAESDPVQAIARCMTLPLQLDDKIWPRSSALESIARASLKKNPGGADAALTELRKVVKELPPGGQIQYLASAADLYLQMEDKDKAGRVVSEGLKVADKMLEQDSSPGSPNKALKAWWPSTDAYRRFLEFETKISDRGALAALQEIRDPEIRTMESIMVARSLLGLTPKR